MKTDQKTWRQIGANNHVSHDYEKEGFYATDPVAIDHLMSKFKPKGTIWEPMCGQGHLSERLKDFGYDVTSTDKIDRGYGRTKDFFEFNHTLGDHILTNPHFKIATDTILHALDLVEEGNNVMMFLKLLFLEGQTRYNKLFDKYPPKYVYVLSKRVVCAMNGEFVKDGKRIASTTAYAWFVWEKGYKGGTTLKWI